VFLAALGKREHDMGGSPRMEGEHLLLVKRQAWKVVVRTAAAGALLTAAAELIAAR
jgi:hypothetical protein